MKQSLILITFLVFLFLSCQKEDDTPPTQPEASIFLEEFADGFVAPVYLTEAPDGSNRIFVLDQPGQIWIINPDGSKQEAPFLDLQDRIVSLNENFDERGLLGLAFHPQFSANGRFYVYYSAPLRNEAPPEWNHTSHISEFTVDANNPNLANPASERIILQVDQPQFNHNGGTILFGPNDNYLYISLGDGGGADDTGLGHVDDWYEVNEGGNSQNITANLLGKILRIDVDTENPYGIPPDNPFVGEEGLDEIYAFGLRNPYRMSFDLDGNRDLIAMDAGQLLYEEINVITRGGNYGWNVKEGTSCFNTDDSLEPRPSCPDADVYGNELIDPVIEFPHSRLEGGLGTVVIGGYVYRGNTVPQLSGRYLFGVWDKGDGSDEGAIFEAEPSGGSWSFEELSLDENQTLGHYLLAFGQSLNGEVFALTSDNIGPSGNTGKVYLITLDTTH